MDATKKCCILLLWVFKQHVDSCFKYLRDNKDHGMLSQQPSRQEVLETKQR